MPDKSPPLKDAEIGDPDKVGQRRAKFDVPRAPAHRSYRSWTRLAGLAKVAMKVSTAPSVNSLAFSADGRTLAAASGRQVLLFENCHGKMLGELGDHPARSIP